MVGPGVKGEQMLAESRAFSGFAVDDISRAKAFYAEKLGLDLTEQNGMLTLHLAGSHDVLVYAREDHEPATFTILNFPVSDIDASVDELVGRGVTFLKYDWVDDLRGIQRRYGPPIAWFTDPAGNILSVIQQ